MSLREEVSKHWIWIASMIFGLGGAFVLQAVQGRSITENTAAINISRERIVLCEQADIRLMSTDEKALLKLEIIDAGIKDLKGTVEKLDMKMNERITKLSDKTQTQFDDLKKILYKPVVSGDLSFSNYVGRASR